MLIYPVGRAPVRGAPSCTTSGCEIATSLTGGLTASAYFDPAIPILGTYPTHTVTHVKWYIQVIYCSIICDSKILATTQMCKADWLNYSSNTIEYCAHTHTHTLSGCMRTLAYVRVYQSLHILICNDLWAVKCNVQLHLTRVSRGGNNSVWVTWTPCLLRKGRTAQTSSLQPDSFSPRCNYDFDGLRRNISWKFYESIPANWPMAAILK